MAKREEMKAAEFLKDHVFMLNGTKRAISAKQMKDKGIKINIPQRYWDSFAVKGIIKATDTQIKRITKKLAK